MNKEIVCQNKTTTKLKISNNKIQSVFKATDIRTGLRLYDNNFIGIAGVIGKADESDLEKKAKSMLSFRIPYPVELTKNVKRTADLSDSCNLSDKELVDITTELLETLAKKYPDFSFSHLVQMIDSTESLRNDCGTELFARDKFVNLGLLIKYKKSLNMMDGFALNLTRGFNFEESLAAATRTLNGYTVLSDINDGETLPVIFADDGLASFFYQHLHGKLFAAGASMFSGKLGEKFFSDKFTLNINRDPKTLATFFDGEGTTLPNDRFSLIENGVIKAPYTSKKVAKDFNLPLTSSAGFVYDAIPDVTPVGLDIADNGKTLHELIGNQKAVLVEMASGGDYTAQGEYSTPVQVAYLWENGKIVGRLPQIAVSSTVLKLFGDDYIGKATDGPIKNNPMFKYLAFNMKVNKIGPHM